nr:DapH/DapD/GlmU-related protein [Methanosarcina horonobensis]
MILKRVISVKKISIEDDVWIGTNATILPGVTIGKNSVIGAGAVVNKSIPPNSVVVGIPAKIIKTIDFFDRNEDNYH